MKPTAPSLAAPAQLRAFILQRFPLARSRHLRDDEPLLESGIIDSLGVLDLVAYLEQQFTISISDEDLSADNFGSIDNLASFVARKLNAGAGEDSWTS